MLEMIIIIEGRMGHEIKKYTRDSLEINRVEKDLEISFIFRQQLLCIYIPLLSFRTCTTFIWSCHGEKINKKENFSKPPQ